MKKSTSQPTTISPITFFESLFGTNSYSSNSFSTRRKINFSLPKFKFSSLKRKELIIIGFVAFVAIVIGLMAWLLASKPQILQGDVQKIEIRPAKASQTLNKEINFPLKNDKGETVSQIKMALDNAELRDEIVVKGQRATAVSGRTFLIINMRIKNDHTQTVQINTRDYIRLIAGNDNDNPLAPDIHNDPVEVQAISTKPTRVGFAINDNSKNLKLKVGEITGDKQTIDLHF